MDPIYFRAGNEAGYAFGTERHRWDGFHVVDVHGVEEISKPYSCLRRYRLGSYALRQRLGSSWSWRWPATWGEDWFDARWTWPVPPTAYPGIA